MAYTTEWRDWSPSGCPALGDPAACYIVDPAKGSPSERIVVVGAHTIVPPSPDPERLGDWWKLAEWFILGAWELNELLAVRPYMRVMGTVLEEEEVRELHWRYGGIIRLVFSSVARQERFQELRDNVLKDEQLVKDALFTLVPIKDIEGAGASWRKKPMTFRPFAIASIGIVSVEAGVLLHNQYFQDLEYAACEREETARVRLGWLFEDAVHLVLARGGQFPSR